jgi:hypothetical protein
MNFNNNNFVRILFYLVWCLGQIKRIAPLPSPWMALKTTKELIALTPEMDCDQMAIGLPTAKSASYFIAKSFWYNVGVSVDNLNVSATPLERVTPEMDCDQMATGLPTVRSASYFIAKTFW